MHLRFPVALFLLLFLSSCDSALSSSSSSSSSSSLRRDRHGRGRVSCGGPEEGMGRNRGANPRADHGDPGLRQIREGDGGGELAPTVERLGAGRTRLSQIDAVQARSPCPAVARTRRAAAWPILEGTVQLAAYELEECESAGETEHQEICSRIERAFFRRWGRVYHPQTTKTGMTSAAESITESLRRTRQLMVQEVERSDSTLSTFEELTSVLRKAESEYKGHRSLLMRTCRLLSTMQHQDVIDSSVSFNFSIVLVLGFLIFLSAVLYVVSKRVGLLTLQRKLVAAIRPGSIANEQVIQDVQ